MIKLSFTSLNTLLGEKNHEWLNKQMGQKVPDYKFLQEGKDSHSIIQKHVSKKEICEDLKHIEVYFPTVEEKDFDEKCHFEFGFKNPEISEEILIHGYYDGTNMAERMFLEIKTSSTNWSMQKYMDSMQRKIYALSNPIFKEAILITGSRNPQDWKMKKPKVYPVPITNKDREDATKWIVKGIKVLEAGVFTGGLNEEGKCDGSCFYGRNCAFL